MRLALLGSVIKIGEVNIRLGLLSASVEQKANMSVLLGLEEQRFQCSKIPTPIIRPTHS